ncbi:MAG: hypothetical protein JWP49_1412 [Phenylobacterium sp.]|jgi:hypothetical protein|nr:hypothetical protein [Phenylobacterium sp.]
MLYALLCYNAEDVVFSWSQAEDDAVMDRLNKVHGKLHDAGKLGPALRLMPTTAAATLRKSDPPVVIDGPFAETKEQLLGFYVVDVENLDEALAIAKDLGQANPGGSYEIRPIRLFLPGNFPQDAADQDLAATEPA